MSIQSLGSSPSASGGIDQLAQQISNQVDANHDGQISVAEFSSFLTTLIGGTASKAAGAKSAVAKAAADTSDPAASAPAVSAPIASQILPSQWTDNNSPYGVTFAGFSPQDHTDLTLADLGTPGKAEKYAVYNYLLNNKVEATNNWAPAAADALNQMYNTTVYHAIDGETIGFGNEYVHSAPNGYGMASGTYNAQAHGEFFWGYV